MSLCNQILDLTDDTNKAILKDILSQAPPPDFVKTAQIATRDMTEKMGRESFALIALTKEGSELRKFPCFDKASTWLSCQYFEKTAHKLPEQAQVIASGILKKACAVYGLDETSSLKAVKTVSGGNLSGGNLYREDRDTMRKTAQVARAEAVVKDDSKYFYALNENYAMPSPEYVKKAEAYFVDYSREFDAQDRNTFADNVLKRAEELKVPLEHEATLAKYASAEYGDIVDVQIRMRQDHLCAKPEMSAALEKIAAYKTELPAKDFAKLLFVFDKKASLNRYYGRGLSDAFRSTFERRQVKQASGYSYEDSSEGVSCTGAELDEAFDKKYTKIKGYFGPTIADSLKKHGCAIFDSMPRDAKLTVAKIAKGEL